MSNTIQIPDDLQDVMAEMMGIAFSERNPKTGKAIKFSTSGHSYLYFRRHGNDYCYTPHPDQDGWYYSFAYVGVGAGSRIGKPKRWTMKRLQCHRLRKAAKARALKMLDAVPSAKVETE